MMRIFADLCSKRTNILGEILPDVNHHRDMQDRTINSSLLALRRELILSGGEGLEHVEALLALRGVRTGRVLVRHPPGQMRKLVLEALREGPMARRALVYYIATQLPDEPPDGMYKRVDTALHELRKKGVIGREGREWGLAP